MTSIEAIAHEFDFMKLSDNQFDIVKSRFAELMIYLKLVPSTHYDISFSHHKVTDSICVFNKDGATQVGVLRPDNCFHGRDHHQLIFSFMPYFDNQSKYYRSIYFGGKPFVGAMELAAKEIKSSLKSYAGL